MEVLYIIIAFVAIIIIWCLITINIFKKANNRVKEAFATMDVYLKKRWDLIPNLIETVKGYAKHEKDTLKEVVEIRNSVKIYDKLSAEQKIKTNEQINAGITKLMAIAEDYPDLKASDNFIKLNQELVQVEDEIAKSRKYYNATIKEYNNKVEMIPSNIIAKLFGYKPKSMFEISSKERSNIEVKL